MGMKTFGTFRHKLTGEVVSQPEHYGRLYPHIYEEVDPSNLRCTDCDLPEPRTEAHDESVSAPETTTIDLYEPEPVKRSRRKDSA